MMAPSLRQDRQRSGTATAINQCGAVTSNADGAATTQRQRSDQRRMTDLMTTKIGNLKKITLTVTVTVVATTHR